MVGKKKKEERRLEREKTKKSKINKDICVLQTSR